ncbi:MAG: hypothetical protein ABR595_10305, partial [Psychroflexus sp.]
SMVKSSVVKSENEAKQILKSDRTLAILNFNASENKVIFKKVDIMDVDDQNDIHLAMIGVRDFEHDLNTNQVQLTENEKEVNSDDLEWEIVEEYKT